MGTRPLAIAAIVIYVISVNETRHASFDSTPPKKSSAVPRKSSHSTVPHVVAGTMASDDSDLFNVAMLIDELKVRVCPSHGGVVWVTRRANVLVSGAHSRAFPKPIVSV